MSLSLLSLSLLPHCFPNPSTNQLELSLPFHKKKSWSRKWKWMADILWKMNSFGGLEATGPKGRILALSLITGRETSSWFFDWGEPHCFFCRKMYPGTSASCRMRLLALHLTQFILNHITIPNSLFCNKTNAHRGPEALITYPRCLYGADIHRNLAALQYVYSCRHSTPWKRTTCYYLYLKLWSEVCQRCITFMGCCKDIFKKTPHEHTHTDTQCTEFI